MLRAESNGVLCFRRLCAAGVAVALAGAVLWAQPAVPRNGLLTPAETAWLQQHPGIRLAPTPDYQPVEFFDAAGNYAGMTAEYFRLIEQRLGYRFEIVRPTPEQWAQLDPALRGADVITASAATPKRGQFWIYSATYLELLTYVITREKAEDGLTPAKLSGQRVAVVRGWAAEEYLRTTWTNLIIVPVADAPSGLRQVSFGLVDAFVSELPVATAWMEKEGISNLKASAEAGYTYRLSISVRRDWPELRAILDKALATITPEERRQILGRWVTLKTPAQQRLEKKRQLWRWGAGGLAALLAAVLLWNGLLAWRVRTRTREIRSLGEKFSKAFRASPDGLAISEVATGRYLEVNEGYCALCGYRREEMLGRTSLELGVWKNPQDRARFVLEFNQSNGVVRNFEMRMGTRSGGTRIILLSSEAIELDGKSCFVSVLHDVTDRVQAEQALRESEEKFSKAFHTSPDVMSITDLETGHYLEVNEAHEKTFGFKREEVIGRSPVELGILDNPAQRQAMLARLQATGSVRDIELQARNRRGEPLTILHSAELIELGGRRCVLRVSHDITGRKRAEAEREQAVAREQAARIEYTLRLIAAQEAERKRIAVELHDSLGQNLLLIKNLADRSLHSEAPEQMCEQVGAISHLATQCIAEARRISRDLHPHQLDHLGLKRALEAMLEQTAQASKIQFTCKFEPVDDLFSGEAAMNLYRIVQESLNNILKHSHASHADIRLERDLREVQLRIEDDGAGFSPDQTGGKKGLGLQNITERVRMLGGELSIGSSPGQGTRIEVVIPVAEAASSS